MTYKEYKFDLHPCFTELKSLESPKSLSNRGVFCYVNEVTLGKNLRMGAPWQWNQPGDESWDFQSHPHDLWGGEGSWRLNQLPVASELINHDYVMKPP